MKKEERNYGIDLVRIIATLCVISVHFQNLRIIYSEGRLRESQTHPAISNFIQAYVPRQI